MKHLFIGIGFVTLLTTLQALPPVVVTSQTLRLWWTPSPDTNATGTLIYGTTNAADFADANAPTNFVLVQDAGLASAIVMTNVLVGTQWYWTATAHDASGAQSVHCNVLSTWIPNPPQNIQPVPVK